MELRLDHSSPLPLHVQAESLLRRHGEQAAADLVWALVNTHEFLFIQ